MTAVARTLHRELAVELWEAARTRRPVPPLSVRHPRLDLADAYAIQSETRALELAGGARIAGLKIGATSEAIQKMFGIDHPDFGYLTDRMLLPDGVALDVRRFIAPKVEGEIAFRMARDLSGQSVTAQDVLDAATEVCPVLEVLDSRIEAWQIGLVDTVADNASSAAVVVGAGVSPDTVDLAAARMVLLSGNAEYTGNGSAVMGHPAESVACLVRILAGFGSGISAGDLVLAGSWSAAVDLAAGHEVHASFGVLGSVSMTTCDRDEACDRTAIGQR
ncbi:fumarylacetoacetate hydrolase family protein [Solwaraspora sp. WMMA2056]|uniref:2-keto-4-pentenoate hydratase n=1 Tax=Solwaraspora sp. WMMA2056 TaxID=3015161 RepID=UPI00259AF3A0|nr:fumarylacetoacetate hydrolase family protein [Solwaraspora sp. WMMA2056]WJK41306.1 fumarylacetoacetate hydrolase family protein [Solwaraspora sp. WMMA2056]